MPDCSFPCSPFPLLMENLFGFLLKGNFLWHWKESQMISQLSFDTGRCNENFECSLKTLCFSKLYNSCYLALNFHFWSLTYLLYSFIALQCNCSCKFPSFISQELNKIFCLSMKVNFFLLRQVAIQAEQTLRTQVDSILKSSCAELYGKC